MYGFFSFTNKYMQQVLKIFIMVSSKSFSQVRCFLYEEQRRIQNPKMERFCEKRLTAFLTVNYFRKTLHVRCLIGL